MIICGTKTLIRREVAAARARGASVGLVPTMGALHEGHMSLVRRSVEENDFTVVSIFVNPAQFGPSEDFEKYPRRLEEDARMCEGAGVGAIFAPEAGEMYARGSSTFVEETRLSRGLCGASRPGHFRGVATVVAKLFNIVQPDRAYFGQKDAQQAGVLLRMARDLDFPVEVVVMPIVREADGLAMSSRNRYLAPGLTREALCLQAAIAKAGELLAGGERRAEALQSAMRDVIGGAQHARIEYIEIVDAESFEPVESVDRRALAALAVYIGDTRLIDNGFLEPAGS